YLPYRRLDRTTIAAVAGGGGGTGTRTVAGYDEDSTTMAVEAGRLALRSAPDGATPRALVFSTVTPAYVDKTNATAVHAALRLDPSVPAVDLGGAVRSSVGALRLALDAAGTAGATLLVAADIRTGRPGSSDEAAGGDAAAALLVGGENDGPVLAELVGSASMTAEFLERWRIPGEARSRQWEDRFGELQYEPLGRAAWRDALDGAGLEADRIDRVAIAAAHVRAARSVARGLGVDPSTLADDLSATVGMTGAAQPGLLLSSLLEQASPGELLGLVVLADGADVFLFRATDAVSSFVPARTVADQCREGGPVPYGTFLRWRAQLVAEGVRRPEPARVSSSAAARNREWKFGFVASRDEGGVVQMPPPADNRESRWRWRTVGTIVTSTVDRLAYSPSPPVVFAVVDFDGGGRLPVELTDVDAVAIEAGETGIGQRVEMTFRCLSSADGIHNYFWKARPVRAS
ncbi:MAG: OB-fold domain-containing protein, partial [Acidimicrobiales bacterium]